MKDKINPPGVTEVERFYQNIHDCALSGELFKSSWIFNFETLAETVTKIAESHGWGTENDGEKIALMHSELSEGLENLRQGCPPSNHIPEFKGIEEELADVIIRIMHTAHKKGWRIAEALLAKIDYNRTRPFKHGDKKF